MAGIYACQPEQSREQRRGRVQPETESNSRLSFARSTRTLSRRRCRRHRRRLVSSADRHVLAEVVVFGQFAQRLLEAVQPTSDNERGVL